MVELNFNIFTNQHILTKNGYVFVENLHNEKEVEIWDGNDWILTNIKKNIEEIEDNNIYKILLSDGCEIVCLNLHSLNIVKIDDFDLSKQIIKLKVSDVKVNDFIYTYNFPVINGSNDILYPYTHGYYCGYMNKINGFKDELKLEFDLIYINLIDDKQKIKSRLDISGKYSFNKSKSILTGLLKVDMDKKVKTPINGSINNKLIWLSGIIDNNGFITKSCDAKYLNISVLSKNFAMDIKMLFNTLGINPDIYLKSDIRKIKNKSNIINEIIKNYWVITLNSEDTNKLFLKSEFDLKLYYLEYDKTVYSIDQDIDRFISVKKISKMKLKKESYILENINSCIINGYQLLI